VAEPQRKADCQVDTNLTTEDSDSETCTLKDDKNEINEEGQTLNERIDSCKRNESKYFFKENNDGYVEICSPGNMNIYDLSKILGFESGGYAIKGIYAAKHKHKLNKNDDYNAIEIHCNLCEPCLVTFNEHFRTHEGPELLYVCNPDFKNNERFAVTPTPPLFFSVRSDLTKIKYRVIHKSLRNLRTRLRNNQDIHGRKDHINR